MSSHSGASETSVFKLSGNAESESGMSFKEDTEPELSTGAAVVPPHLRHATAALSYGESYGKAPRLSAEQRSPSPMGNTNRFQALTNEGGLSTPKQSWGNPGPSLGLGERFHPALQDVEGTPNLHFHRVPAQGQPRALLDGREIMLQSNNSSPGDGWDLVSGSRPGTDMSSVPTQGAQTGALAVSTDRDAAQSRTLSLPPTMTRPPRAPHGIPGSGTGTGVSKSVVKVKS